MKSEKLKNQVERLPNSPGVYFFYDHVGRLLYVGKAYDLKKRVSQHFERPHDIRIEQMLTELRKITVRKTASNIEALILESELVNSLQPKYNVKLRDDKTFLGVYVTDEPFPRIFPARITNKKLPKGEFYGPYTSAKTLRQALKIIRKIFPYCADPRRGKPCLYYYLKQCPGPCAGRISREDYRRIIRNLKLFLGGRKSQLIKQLRKQLRQLSREQKFEQAARVRDSLLALEHIRDVNLAFEQDDKLAGLAGGSFRRVEGYDVSNVSGTSAVGVMVVARYDEKNLTFENWEYRQFKIRTVTGIDDVAMMAEVVSRRLKHGEWPLPKLMVVDGGKGHYNRVRRVLGGRDIKIIACAKGRSRKKFDLYFNEEQLGDWLGQLPHLKPMCARMVTEAHRFAIKEYRRMHRKALTSTRK